MSVGRLIFHLEAFLHTFSNSFFLYSSVTSSGRALGPGD